MDYTALKWLLLMNGAHRKLDRWRLRLAEFEYVLQTRPDASHHAADTMSRISTPAGDEVAIPDAVPCMALPNSSAAWQGPPETKGALLFPLTLVGQQGRPSEGLGVRRWPRADQVQARDPRGRTVQGVVPSRRHVLVGHRRIPGDGEQRPRDSSATPSE